MAARVPKRSSKTKRAESDRTGAPGMNAQTAGPPEESMQAEPADLPGEPEAAGPTNGRAAEGGNHAPTAMRPESEKVIRELVHIFRLLSDESRLRILTYLTQQGELHVSDLCARLGQTQPAVSHHLALLRVSGLIEPRRVGKHNFYSIRIDRLSEMLVKLLSITGSMPKKFRFHDFTLTHQGR